MKLGLADTLDGEKLLTAVRLQIEAEPCWLLVLDNADDLELFGVGRQSPEQSEPKRLCSSGSGRARYCGRVATNIFQGPLSARDGGSMSLA